MGNNKNYDLIIVGGGPAGLTASIYASCFHLRNLVIGKELGGQMRIAPDILNYPGFLEVSGKKLTEKIIKQAKARGGEIVEEEVVGISKLKTHLPAVASCPPRLRESLAGAALQGLQAGNSKLQLKNQNHEITKTQKHKNTEKYDSGYFQIRTKNGDIYRGKALIIATGMERRKLNVPGEMEYTGRGVLYCATCEKQDYDGKICGVVGGANSAAQAAVTVSSAAKKVYLIYRGDKLRGDPVWLGKIKDHPNIEVLYNANVEEILGDGEKLTGVRLKIGNSGIGNNIEKIKQRSNEGELKLEKLFVEIGGVPGTALLAPLGVRMDKGGYVYVTDKLETSIPGIFAAGDLVHYGFSIEQIASAVGLGARAAFSAYEYINREAAPTVWGKARIKRRT